MYNEGKQNLWKSNNYLNPIPYGTNRKNFNQRGRIYHQRD